MAANGSAPSLALPLDQGRWGTCAAHAFAHAVSSGLMGKYDVPIEREKIVEMLKQQPETAEVWEGIDIKAICVGWNQLMEKPHTWIDDTNKTKRYKFKVTSKICSSTTEFAVDQIENINDAYQQLFIFQAAEIQILTHITIFDDRGHNHHAVSAFRTYDAAPKMRAMNSWGANQPTLTVERENFLKCIFLNVVITEKQSTSDRLDIVTEQLPVTTLAWKEAYSTWKATQFVMPDHHLEKLSVKLRNLIMIWADAEPRMGNNIYYHNILTSEDIKIIASNAPTTLRKLSNLGILVDERLEKYGSRIVQLIKRYVRSVRTRRKKLDRNQQSISNSISESEDGDDEESQSTTDGDQFGFVSGVIVSGAGSEGVDGTYERDGIFHGAPRFSKLGRDCNYSIYKLVNVSDGKYCWMITPFSLMDNVPFPDWMHSRIGFYFSNVVTLLNYPPLTGWKLFNSSAESSLKLAFIKQDE